MKKTLRRLLRGFVFLTSLILLLAVISTVLFGLKGGMSPATNPFEAKLKGHSCEIWQDPQGISHARADERDLSFACIGYFHGRDRAWQMDLFKRTWEGRKSEVLGVAEMRSDFTMRVLGLRERAESIFAAMPADMQELLWS